MNIKVVTFVEEIYRFAKISRYKTDECLGCFIDDLEAGVVPLFYHDRPNPEDVLRGVALALNNAGFNTAEIRHLVVHPQRWNEVSDEMLMSGKWQIGCILVSELIKAVQTRWPENTSQPQQSR